MFKIPRPGRWPRRASLAAAAAALVVAAWPAEQRIPVAGATPQDWNRYAFWYHPWGPSGVHKGIDIFADEGTPVLASTGGLVVHRGRMGRGGNVLIVLGPRLRLHYYAHLSSSDVAPGEVVRRGERIGSVGTTGNAAGKPPHLHYSILTGVPYPWRVSWERQGWKKALYLDPDTILRRGR